MKNILSVLLVGGIIVLSIALMSIITYKMYDSYLNEGKESRKKVSFPEEIDIAESGDLLIVEKVTTDSIYLGYSNK